MGTEGKRIGVGVNVFIYNRGRILLGQRKGSGEGEWCLPGGKLRHGEHLKEGAIREVVEETGILLNKLELVSVVNDVRFNVGEHYIHFNFRANTIEDSQTMEPNQFHAWEWFFPTALPTPIFYWHEKLIKAFQQGVKFVD